MEREDAIEIFFEWQNSMILNTYENDDILSTEEFKIIHLEMLNEIGTDAGAIELYNELLFKAIEYSNIRAKWAIMSIAEKTAADQGRTMKHDALIVKFNQLAKYLKLHGKPAYWRDRLGDEKITRKTIGDMGCYIVFATALSER